jgi:hypothetical protein
MAVLQGRGSTVFFIAVVVAMIVASCGGDDSSSSSSSSESSSNANQTSSTKTDTTASTKPSAEPSAEFRGKGPNSEIPTAGKEASVAEREAASKVLEENLEARAARDWEAQCATLTKPLIKGIEKSSSVLGAGSGCAKALEAQAAPASPSSLANTMTGPIDAFRVVGGTRGFALYHGVNGKDYVMPMLMEGGEWKVTSLTEQEV